MLRMRSLLHITLCAALALLSVAARADAEPVAKIVKDTTHKVLTRLRAEGDAVTSDPRRLNEIVNEMILPHFDFTKMSQRVLGRHWRDATPGQRERFVKEFQSLLVRTYSTALIQYRDQPINFLPAREQSADEVLVRTEVVTASGPKIPITYQLYNNAGDWKVFDVTIDGVSLVINYRSNFSGEIAKSGIDGLINQLAHLNAEKLGGT